MVQLAATAVTIRAGRCRDFGKNDAVHASRSLRTLGQVTVLHWCGSLGCTGPNQISVVHLGSWDFVGLPLRTWPACSVLLWDILTVRYLCRWGHSYSAWVWSPIQRASRRPVEVAVQPDAVRSDNSMSFNRAARCWVVVLHDICSITTRGGGFMQVVVGTIGAGRCTAVQLVARGTQDLLECRVHLGSQLAFWLCTYAVLWWTTEQLGANYGCGTSQISQCRTCQIKTNR